MRSSLMIAVVIASSALMASVLASTSQVGVNSQHSHRSDDSTMIAGLSCQRQLPAGDSVNSLVSQDTLLVVPTLGGLYLLNTRLESLRVFVGNFRGVPAVANGRVVATSSNTKTLECYPLDGGSPSWTLGFRLTPSFPTLINDTVYVTCIDQVYAIGLEDGRVYWISDPIQFGFLPDMTVCGNPNDSLIYAVSQGGGVLDPAMVVAVIDRRTGHILSAQGFGYGYTEMGVRTTATLSDGHLYVETWDGVLFTGYGRLINVPQNTLNWEVRGINTYHTSSAVDGLVVFAGNGLVAYDSTGQYRWTADLGRIGWSSPIISADRVIWVGNDEGELFGVDVTSGLIRQRFQCGNSPLTSPATTDFGQIVVRDVDGVLYCFGTTVAVEEPRINLSQNTTPDGIYDVVGRRVSHTSSGVYFRVFDGRVTKVVNTR